MVSRSKGSTTANEAVRTRRQRLRPCTRVVRFRPAFGFGPSLSRQTSSMKQKSKTPVRVAITGAAGQIGYQLAFRIASGQLFGGDQPIILQLLEITPALNALNGVAMELDDCAFETLHGIVVTDKADV